MPRVQRELATKNGSDVGPGCIACYAGVGDRQADEAMADAMLDHAILKDGQPTPAVKRGAGSRQDVAALSGLPARWCADALTVA